MDPYRDVWGEAAFPELGRGVLAAVVAKHRLGTAAAEIRRPASIGVVNSVYALGERWVLRVPKPLEEALADTYTESVAVPVARAAGVRTPALVVFDDDRDILDVPFTVYEQVPGQGLVRLGPGVDATAEVWRALGRDLATLHLGVTTCPDPQGHLDGADRDLDPGRLLAALVDEGHLHADGAAWLSGRLDELRPAVLAADGYRRFLHNDVQPTNVMVDAGRYQALIDWGDAGWGDPALDLCAVPPRAVPLVLDGYREVGAMDGADTLGARIAWDHLTATVRGLRRPAAPGRHDWARPPGARLVELMALVLDDHGRPPATPGERLAAAFDPRR